MSRPKNPNIKQSPTLWRTMSYEDRQAKVKSVMEYALRVAADLRVGVYIVSNVYGAPEKILESGSIGFGDLKMIDTKALDEQLRKTDAADEEKCNEAMKRLNITGPEMELAFEVVIMATRVIGAMTINKMTTERIPDVREFIATLLFNNEVGSSAELREFGADALHAAKDRMEGKSHA